MKIRNTTDFDTAALRSLLRRVVREVEGTLAKDHPLRHEGLGLSKWLPVNVHNRATFILEQCDVWIRQRRLGLTHTTGRAWLHGRKLRLTLGDADAAKAVWLMRHEVWHLFGVEHEHFPSAIMHESGGALAAVRELYGIAESETLPLAVPRAPKAKLEPEARAMAKLESIEARRKAWTSKLKRAQTALAKLTKQARYYERTAAVAASRKAGPS